MKADTKRRVFVVYSKCVICSSTKDLQIDHIYPKSKGGSNFGDNLFIQDQDWNRSEQDNH